MNPQVTVPAWYNHASHNPELRKKYWSIYSFQRHIKKIKKDLPVCFWTEEEKRAHILMLCDEVTKTGKYTASAYFRNASKHEKVVVNVLRNGNSKHIECYESPLTSLSQIIDNLENILEECKQY